MGDYGPQIDASRPGRTFRADLGLSAHAWRVSPGLLFTSVALAVTNEAVELFGNSGRSRALALLLLFPLGLFGVGFVGTQRVWYLRAYRGGSLQGAEVWAMTWAFLGRFLTLGLVAGLVFTPFAIFAAVVGGPNALIAVLVIASLAGDVALTFVCPALAFETASTNKALREGLRTLTETWPASAWYVCAPALVLVTLPQVLRASTVGAPAVAGLSVVGSVAGLWFRGAVAAFYLRLHPAIGDDGAAFMAAPNRWAS